MPWSAASCGPVLLPSNLSRETGCQGSADRSLTTWKSKNYNAEVHSYSLLMKELPALGRRFTTNRAAASRWNRIPSLALPAAGLGGAGRARDRQAQLDAAWRTMASARVTACRRAAIGVTNQRETTVVWTADGRAGLSGHRVAVPAHSRFLLRTGNRPDGARSDGQDGAGDRCLLSATRSDGFWKHTGGARQRPVFGNATPG